MGKCSALRLQTKGDRADSLSTVGDELHAAPVEHREVLQQDLATTRKDYTDEQGTLSCCQILKRMLGKTNIDVIDGNETLWQLNWV